MKFNFRKISAIASSALMVGMTMGVAAAASYPAPFISGGTANVAVVYGTGSGVSTLDVVEAGNIQADLQSRMGTSSGGGGSVSGGDSVLIGKSSDNLNINDGWEVFTGSVTDDDLSTLLADGTYIADDNDEFDFEQKITLGNATLSHFQDSDYEDLIGASVKTPAVGHKISSNTFILNYTLDFLSDAESDVVSGDLDDIEGSDLVFLGKTYYVSDWKNGTNANYYGKVTLLDAAERSSVSEGETVTVQSSGSSYDVSITFIDNDEVVFDVSGQRVPASGKLQKGESFRLNDGAYLGVTDISRLEVSGEVGSSAFSIGSGKLEFGAGPGGSVKLNDDTIDELKAWFKRGSVSSGVEKVDKIEIEWRVDDENFVTPDFELLMPGFEALKFSMNPLVRAEEEVVTIEKSDDQVMELRVPLKDGTVSINFLYGNSTGEFTGIGKDATELLRTTNESMIYFLEKNATDNVDAWFPATYNISGEGESYILRAKVDEDKDAGRNETDIQKLTEDNGWVTVCEEKVAGDSCSIGQVTLTVSHVVKNTTQERVNFTASSNVNFHTLITDGGLQIALPFYGGDNIGANGEINSSTAANNQQLDTYHSTIGADAGHGHNTFWLWFYSENKDDDLLSGTNFNITIDDTSDSKFQVSQVNNGGSGGPNARENEAIADAVYENYIKDDVAPRILHYTKGDEDYAEIYYPSGDDSETYAEVFLTEPGATLTTGSGGSASVSQLGNILFKDNEQSSWSSKNVIIVGGSCINSAAATALGVSSGTCGSAFTAATGVGSGQYLIESINGAFTSGRIALVVAGYDVDNTVAASSYLRNVGVDTAAGNKYVGTSATEATIQVESA